MVNMGNAGYRIGVCSSFCLIGQNGVWVEAPGPTKHIWAGKWSVLQLMPGFRHRTSLTAG
jgi:hypothetical protein